MFCVATWMNMNMVNMDVSRNNKNTFGSTSLYALRVHRQFQRQKLPNLIDFTVKLKLNSS